MRHVVAPIITAVAAALAATCHTSCRPAEAIRHPENDAVYATQLEVCVAKASTLAESKACRRMVNRAWGLCDQKGPDGRGLCDE